MHSALSLSNFVFVLATIITLINPFSERFESKHERNQPFSVPSRSRSRNPLTISTQWFLHCFRRVFTTHELWQYDIQQKFYTTVKIIISRKVLFAVLLNNFGLGQKKFWFRPRLGLGRNKLRSWSRSDPIPIKKKFRSRSQNRSFSAGTEIGDHFAHLFELFRH
jgi:hypothetical protein